MTEQEKLQQTRDKLMCDIKRDNKLAEKCSKLRSRLIKAGWEYQAENLTLKQIEKIIYFNTHAGENEVMRIDCRLRD